MFKKWLVETSIEKVGGIFKSSSAKGRSKNIDFAIKEGVEWVFEILYDYDKDLFNQVYDAFTDINLEVGNKPYDLIKVIDERISMKESLK